MSLVWVMWVLVVVACLLGRPSLQLADCKAQLPAYLVHSGIGTDRTEQDNTKKQNQNKQKIKFPNNNSKTDNKRPKTYKSGKRNSVVKGNKNYMRKPKERKVIMRRKGRETIRVWN